MAVQCPLWRSSTAYISQVLQRQMQRLKVLRVFLNKVLNLEKLLRRFLCISTKAIAVFASH